MQAGLRQRSADSGRQWLDKMMQDSQARAIENFLLHCHKKVYRKKQLIINEGDPTGNIYYVISGSVYIMKRAPNSKREIILSYLNQGEFFGEFGFFDEDSTQRSALVRARTNTELAILSYSQMRKLHFLLPELLFILAGQMARRLYATSSHLSDLVFIDVKGRIANTLTDLCKQPEAMSHPEGTQIRITRQELGRLVGCSREMAGRVLKELAEQDQLISVSGKTIVVYRAS